MGVKAEQKRVCSADGTEIYYEVYAEPSDKPTLFFVHGIGGDLDAWQFVREPLLAAGYSAVALDLRGSGYSGHPRTLKSYRLERMLEDITSVIEAEGLERVALVGHSGGAVLTLAFALAHPDKLSSLILLAGSYTAPAYARSRLLRALYAPCIALLAWLSPRARAPWHSPYPAGKHHKEVELYGLARTIYKNSLCSYLSMCKTLMDINFESSLAHVAMPTLLVVGARDSIYPPALSKTMGETIPNAQVVVVPNANHVLPLNNPQEVVHAVLNFLTTKAVL